MLLLILAVPEASASKIGEDSADGRQVVSVSRQLSSGTIVISLSDRRLYHVRETGRAVSYPVATPRDEDLWTGTKQVTAKRSSPPWRPTPQMRKDNPRLPTFVPGNHPYNPMGSHALYLGDSYYRIHGTDAPWLVGRNVSKGCIRLHNTHVQELFDTTSVGAQVIVTRESVARQL